LGVYDIGFRVQDPRANLAYTRSRPIKFGSWGLDLARNEGVDGDCRVCAAAGDLLHKFTGGEQIGGFSHESEHDLAVMVSDFWENEGSGNEPKYSSDSDSGRSDLGHLADRVLFHKRAVDQCESDLLSAVRSILLSINENHLHVFKGDGQCSCSCIRHFLVKHLRISGYDAAVCLSRWQGFDKVPGGDHEYVDVVVNGNHKGSERLIIDIDFRSHFEIARAIKPYDEILSSLPVVYVGSFGRLKQFLRAMVDAAEYSLRRNSMPLPPWRSLDYLQAKWQSKCDRNHDIVEKQESKCGIFSDHNQCIGHLRRLKSSLLSEVDN
ncbi:uncharacterized protein LOC109850365, partial [Asparagus officinalis]